METWINYIVAIMSGLTVAIPLIIKLIEYVQKAVKEKNWNALINLLMQYMVEAETKFEDGATRKEWVMVMVQTSAKTVNYDVDMDVISKLIDELCKMSKSVNAPINPVEHEVERTSCSAD